MTIQQFIDLGWYTIPFKGEIKRLSNGKKTLPEFPKGWREKYTKEFNTRDAKLGGVFTGKKSGIIAIDCDDPVTYRMFTSLDADYKAHFVSVGKQDSLGNEIEAGTIIYKFLDDLDETYICNHPGMHMEFYSNSGFVYLPCENNKTKQPIDMSQVELKEPPEEVIALIKALKPVKAKVEHEVLKNKTWSNHLAPQVERFTHTKKVTKELFKILTPKDFRDTEEYSEKGFLEPDEVPEGRGSEYLMKVSAILGADSSIDEELYMTAMETINSHFSDPMPKVRLSATIIEPMVEERSTVNGEPIWQYDENWESDKLTVVTKRNNVIESFFDPNRVRYYAADLGQQRVKTFMRDSDFYSYLETVAVDPPAKKEAKTRLPLVDVVSSPAYDFGFFESKNEQAFNTFVPTIALSIFKNPEMYAKNYARPVTTLSYLESLIPDNYMRNYLLRFLRRKLDKFDYSPAILYFLGVSGAGKDTFVHLIELLIGSAAMARPTTKEFLEMHNGWILDKYFAQLDEYGNQLSRFDEKEQALGKLKAYTGKSEVQIRQMRTDGFNYEHHITFIMTANKNPLFFDHDDRRIALFNCPNDLKAEQWVIEAGGTSNVINQMYSEINNFAYYLATEVDNLSADEFMTPPETDDKKSLIASKFNASMRLAFMLNNQMFEELQELTVEFDCPTVLDGAPEGRIYEEDIFDLYYEMTDGKGTKRGLTSAMKEFDKVPTTRGGVKSYYYNIPALRNFRLKPFAPIKEDDV